MKQHISNSDWDELEDKQKLYYLNMVHKMNRLMDINEIDLQDWWKIINIGQMIEFLGDDWLRALGIVDSKNKPYPIDPSPNELCNALWTACRYKLKEK